MIVILLSLYHAIKCATFIFIAFVFFLLLLSVCILADTVSWQS